MKRIVWTAIALLALLGGMASAGEIYIPDNNPSQGTAGSNSWPFNTYSAWRYHLLLKANYLGGKPFRIKEVSIAFSGTRNGWSATQFQLRIAHTTRNTLSATFAQNFGTSPVALIDGPLTFNAVASTWSPLGITSGFLYDGRSNLVLEVRYRRNTTSGVTVWTSNQLERNYTHMAYSTDPYNAATAFTPVPGPMMGMKVRFTTVDTQIIGSGTGRIGSTILLNLLSPPDGGLAYQVGTSLGMGPTPIGNRAIGLSLDTLLVVSVGGHLPAVFQDYAGLLDTKGQGVARLNIPAHPALIGIRLHSAFLTLKNGAPFNIENISDTFTFTVAK